MKILLGFLVVANLLSYAVYGLDKWRARRGKRRIPERELLLWAAAGGSLGALVAMRQFRHKTRSAFRWAVYAIAALQAIVIVWVL